MNKIKAYFNAFGTSLLLLAETRLVYSMKANHIRALTNVRNQSDVEVVRDALDTAIIVKQFALTDDHLIEILKNYAQKGGKK